jgi:hypothetical protein
MIFATSMARAVPRKRKHPMKNSSTCGEKTSHGHPSIKNQDKWFPLIICPVIKGNS